MGKVETETFPDRRIHIFSRPEPKNIRRKRQQVENAERGGREVTWGQIRQAWQAGARHLDFNGQQQGAFRAREPTSSGCHLRKITLTAR